MAGQWTETQQHTVVPRYMGKFPYSSAMYNTQTAVTYVKYSVNVTLVVISI